MREKKGKGGGLCFSHIVLKQVTGSMDTTKLVQCTMCTDGIHPIAPALESWMTWNMKYLVTLNLGHIF